MVSADEFLDSPSPASQPMSADAFLDSAQPQQPGYFERVGQDLSNRGQQFSEAAAYNPQKQSMLDHAQSYLRGVGAIGGAMGDIAGEAAVSGFRALPQSAQEPFKRIAQLAAPAVEPVVKGYSALQQSFPETMKDVAAVGNIATAIPAGFLAKKGANVAGAGLEKAGVGLEKAGVNAAASQKFKFVRDLVTEKQTPTVKNEIASKSRAGIFGDTRQLDPFQQETINTVAQLNVGGHKSMLSNYNIIKDANIGEAVRLKQLLSVNNVPINQQNYVTKFSNAIAQLQAAPSIVGDGAVAVNKLLEGAQKIIDKHPMTASGLLDARKEFDALATAQKGTSIFNPTLHGPLTEATRAVRQTMNDLIAEANPSIAVKDSLNKQFHLYNAMDGIETKLGEQGKNVFSRGANRVGRNIPSLGYHGLGKVGVALGLAGGAQAFPAAIPLAAAGALGLGAYKAAPTVAKSVGSAVKNIGKVLK